MSNEVSSFNAKTHLSNLLAQVQTGKEFIITKHNYAIAKLIPIDKENKDNEISNVIDQIRNSRQNYRLKLDGGIEALRTEGRR